MSSAEILGLGPQRIKRLTGSAFRISFHPEWQIDNGFFNRPIMARTQILVHRWGHRTRISGGPEALRTAHKIDLENNRLP